MLNNFDMKSILGFFHNKIFNDYALNYFSKKEILLFYFILAFCFFSFQHSDLLHTGGCSFALLNGNFLNFYDAIKETMGGSNYLLTSYIIFAVWNIPIKLLGIINAPTADAGMVLFWYKLLTTVFFIFSVKYFHKILIKSGIDKNNSNLITIVWITSPLLLFSQFIFGQTDIFTMFFLLIGLNYYFDGRMMLFSLFLGLSITFKYFPVFIFIPLLLLVEKRPLQIIKNMIIFFIPIALTVLPYIHIKAFRADVLGFSAASRIMNAQIQIHEKLQLSIYFVLWAIICVYNYLKLVEDKKFFFQYVFYLCSTVFILLFSLILWHPQWLLIITPFIAVTTCLNKKINEFLFLDFVMMYFFIGFTVRFWSAWVDQNLFFWGYGETY